MISSPFLRVRIHQKTSALEETQRVHHYNHIHPCSYSTRGTHEEEKHFIECKGKAITHHSCSFQCSHNVLINIVVLQLVFIYLLITCDNK